MSYKICSIQLRGIHILGYSINQRNLYMKYRKWFCVLNSYSINRNIQLRDIQLSGVHCIWMKVGRKLAYEELQIKFHFCHGWPTVSWVIALCSKFVLKLLLKKYKSPTGPNKFSRGITPTKADQRGPNDTWSLLCRYKLIKKNSLIRRHRKARKTKF